MGHRVVHGMGISAPALLSAAVVAQIQDAAVLAPLHNAAGLQGIQAAQEVFGDAIPQVMGEGAVGGGWGRHPPGMARRLGAKEGGGRNSGMGRGGGEASPGVGKWIV